MRPGGGIIFRSTVRPVFIAVRDGFVRWLERRNGIETSPVVQLGKLGIAAPERGYYKPAPWLTLRRALPRRSVGPQDAFIDFGSGMGRIVFQAAAGYPFKRVAGLELSPQLHKVAEANIARNRHRFRAREVQLICGDALAYEIPDDVTVAFFNNPFTGDIFATVLDHLLASVDRNPRPLRLIYFNPVEHDRLMATGRCRVVKRIRGLRPGKDWARSNSTHVYLVQ
jgi:hypothetical protein